MYVCIMYLFVMHVQVACAVLSALCACAYLCSLPVLWCFDFPPPPQEELGAICFCMYSALSCVFGVAFLIP